MPDQLTLLDCYVVAGCVAPASLTIVTEFYIIINAETRIQPSIDGIDILPFQRFTSDRLESDRLEIRLKEGIIARRI